MQVSHALAYSRLSPQAAATVLANQLEITKTAGTGLLAALQNPVNANGTPMVGAETLRNALIGLGAGGIAGGVSEFNKPEKERNYGRILDKALLGGMMGGGGTLAWRQLVNSGNAATPAVFQESWDSLTGNTPMSRIEKAKARIRAARDAAATPTADAGNTDDIGMRIAENEHFPTSVQSMGVDLHEGNALPLAAAAGGSLGGAAVGMGLGAGAGRMLRAMRHPGTAAMRAGARGHNALNLIGGKSMDLEVPKYPAGSRAGRLGGILLRILSGVAGGYAGATAAHEATTGN